MDWEGGGVLPGLIFLRKAALTVSRRWNFINPCGSGRVFKVGRCIQRAAPCILDELVIIGGVRARMFAALQW